jgi:hypothetical protein
MEKLKLYLCLSDDGKLSLQTRFEVDEWIKNIEEAMGAFSQTIIGPVELPNEIPYFFIVFMNGQKTTTYDLVQAADMESAKIKVTTKKRNAGKRIDFKRVFNIADIIKEYTR